MKNTSLDTSIRYIKGVGEAREKLMIKLGIRTLSDLVGYFPRAYEDRTIIKNIGSLIIGETVCVRAMAATEPRLSHIRKGLDLVKLRAVDDSDSLDITFFNQVFVKDAIKQGETYIFYGSVSGTLLKPEMTNPVFERDTGRGVGSGLAGDGFDAAEDGFGASEGGSGASGGGFGKAGGGSVTGCIVPVYSLTAGLSQKMIMNAVRSGLDKCADELPDVLPEGIVRSYELCRARYAYENIHFPADMTHLSIARKRLIFEELFVLATAMRFMRDKRGQNVGRCIKMPDFGIFYDVLPYQPTRAQKRVIDEAASDMVSGKLMSRLIQGDVGSGKTLVAAACCWMTSLCGHQSAFMVPTEILAKQHYNSLSKLLEPFGIRVGLLTGSKTAKGKRETYEMLNCGQIDLIVGTHALISEGVSFKDLALVITDEQHRFGVNQRSLLTEKGDSPHVLVMSATPIPRTLALIIYGDLDVSIIDEMPPGRREIETYIAEERHRERIYKFIEKLVNEGRQIYIICPMVEEDDDTDGLEDVKSAKEYHDLLSKKIFPHLKVTLVHGKMPAKEKDAAMSAFASGESDILVATTVVEVGVDVANAALIVIENADRFGLSQLHQLRGRVGRGMFESYCVLFHGKSGGGFGKDGYGSVSRERLDRAGDGSVSRERLDKTGDGSVSRERLDRAGDGSVSRERLDIMKSTNDGFKIAEEDLRLRGPGDFFGSRQHGLPEMRIANFAADMLVLRQAQDAAEKLLRDDPGLLAPENRKLLELIKRLFELNADKLT